MTALRRTYGVTRIVGMVHLGGASYREVVAQRSGRPTCGGPSVLTGGVTRYTTRDLGLGQSPGREAHVMCSRVCGLDLV